MTTTFVETTEDQRRRRQLETNRVKSIRQLSVFRQQTGCPPVSTFPDGTPGDMETCAIARYLQECGVERPKVGSFCVRLPADDARKLARALRRPVLRIPQRQAGRRNFRYVPLTRALRQFRVNFDLGGYPSGYGQRI